MSIIDDIFGSKNQTKSNSTQTVTPVPLESFRGLIDALGPRALELLNRDPSSWVAGLDPMEQRGMSALENLIGNSEYANQIGKAQNVLDVSNTDARTKLMNPYQINPNAYQIDPAALRNNQQFTSQTVNTAPSSKFYGAERVQTSPLTTGDIQGRMSPYIQSVLNPALQEFDLQQGIQSANSRARRAGLKAFGNENRSALMEDYLSGLQRSKVTGDLLQKGYEAATTLATGDEERALRAALGNQQASLGEQGLIQQMDLSGQEIKSREAMSNQQADLERQRLMLTQGQGNQDAALRAALGNQSSGYGALANNQNAYMTGAYNAGNIGAQAAQGMGQLAGQNQNNLLSLIQGLFGAGATSRDIAQRTAQAPWTALSNAANIAYGSPMGQTGTMSGTSTTTARNSLFDIGTGIARSVAGMSFRHGGLVPAYAGGGLVDDEPPIPSFVSAFPGRKTPRYKDPGIGWPSNDDMYGRMAESLGGAPLMDDDAMAALFSSSQVSADNTARPSGRGRFNFNKDRSINWSDDEGPGAFERFTNWIDSVSGPETAVAGSTPTLPPVDDEYPKTDQGSAPSMFGLSEFFQKMVNNGDPTGPSSAMAQTSEIMPGLGPDIYVPKANEPQAALDPYEQSSVIPSGGPALRASSTSDLMRNTLGALTNEVKKPKSFLGRMRDFLYAPSTAESFALFSPGWAALAERNAQKEDKQMARQLQMLSIMKPDSKEIEIARLMGLGLSRADATKLAYGQAGTFVDPFTKQRGGTFDNVADLLGRGGPQEGQSSISRNFSGASPALGAPAPGGQEEQAALTQQQDGPKPILADVEKYGGKAAFQEGLGRYSLGLFGAPEEVNTMRQNYRLLRESILRAKGGSKMSNEEAKRLLEMLPEEGLFEDPNRAYDILSQFYRDMFYEMKRLGPLVEDQSMTPEIRKDAAEKFLAAQDAVRRIGDPANFPRPSKKPKESGKKVPRITTQEEYDALPSGSTYETEDGEATKP